MLTIGISGSKELVYLHAPCEAKDNKKVRQSAHMLEAVTCSTMANIIRGGFRRDLLTSQELRAYLDDFANFMIYPLFRKSMFEILLVANRIGAQRVHVIQLEANPLSKGMVQLRKNAVITSWLQRHLPLPFHDQFEVRWIRAGDATAGLFSLYNERTSFSPRCLAEIADGKFILNSDKIRQSFREQIGINEKGKCVYCDTFPSRPARHTNSTKHRTAVIAAIRHAVRLLNTPKILKVVNCSEAGK